MVNRLLWGMMPTILFAISSDPEHGYHPDTAAGPEEVCSQLVHQSYVTDETISCETTLRKANLMFSKKITESQCL